MPLWCKTLSARKHSATCLRHTPERNCQPLWKRFVRAGDLSAADSPRWQTPWTRAGSTRGTGANLARIRRGVSKVGARRAGHRGLHVQQGSAHGHTPPEQDRSGRRGPQDRNPVWIDSETCPVRTIQAWIEEGALLDGALFRSINRHGQVQPAA